MSEDIQNLNLLSIFHYIVGGLTALFSCMFLIHLFLGIFMIVSPETLADGSGEAPPEFVGYIFAIIGGVAFILGLTFSGFLIYSGVMLRRQRKRMLSFVLACIECLSFPFGTALGIFTIIVLSRDSVKQIYDNNSMAGAPESSRTAS